MGGSISNLYLYKFCHIFEFANKTFRKRDISPREQIFQQKPKFFELLICGSSIPKAVPKRDMEFVVFVLDTRNF